MVNGWKRWLGGLTLGLVIVGSGITLELGGGEKNDARAMAMRDVIGYMACADESWLVACRDGRFMFSSLADMVGDEVCAPLKPVASGGNDGFFIAHPAGRGSCYVEPHQEVTFSSVGSKDYQTNLRYVRFERFDGCDLSTGYVVASLPIYIGDRLLPAYSRFPSSDGSYPSPSYPSGFEFPPDMAGRCAAGETYVTSGYDGPWFAPKFSDHSDACRVVAGESLFACEDSIPTSKAGWEAVFKDHAEPGAAIEDNQTVTTTITRTADESEGLGDVEAAAKAPYDVRLDLNLTHTHIGDLHGVLVSPSGRRYVLFANYGGSTNDIVGSFGFTVGSYGAELGEWSLIITDNGNGDRGVLHSWELTFIKKAHSL